MDATAPRLRHAIDVATVLGLFVCYVALLALGTAASAVARSLGLGRTTAGSAVRRVQRLFVLFSGLARS